jgi:hypothetical protein
VHGGSLKVSLGDMAKKSPAFWQGRLKPDELRLKRTLARDAKRLASQSALQFSA